MVVGARRRCQFSVVLRVVTLNVNGIRSAAGKGLFRWLAAQKADVVCLQEIKAQEADLDGAQFSIKGYERYLHAAVFYARYLAIAVNVARSVSLPYVAPSAAVTLRGE